jgi:hypothetical protein
MGGGAQAVRSTSAVRAGIFLGLVVGITDAVLAVIENPRSFPGWRSPAGFVGASVLLHLGLGVLAGILFAGVRRIRGMPPRALFAAGLVVAIFVWVAIRIHVRWYFGEPLTSAKSAPAYTAAALGAAAAAFAITRMLRRSIDGVLEARGSGWERAVLWIAAGCVGLVVLGQRRASPANDVHETSPNAPDILFITLDTTRADHLSCYGYPRGTTPAIDRLARMGTIRENVYAAIPLTNPSHTTMFTGRLPREHGALNNGSPYVGEAPSFVEQLAEHGYHCAAFVSGIPLKAGLSGLDRGFSVYDDSFSVFDRLHPMVTSLAALRAANRLVPMDLVERRARDTVRLAIAWLHAAKGPSFTWVHLYDPHSPYDAPAVMRARFARESDVWTADGKPVTKWPVADYDAELRELDRHLEDLIREWEAIPTGPPRESRRERVAILTADHGEGLEQHGELTHGRLLHEEDLHVPWIETPIGSRRVHEEEGLRARQYGRVEWGARTVKLIDRSIRTAAFSELPWGLGTDWDSQAAADAANPQGFLAETFAPEGRESKAAFIEVPMRVLGNEPIVGRKLIVNFATGATEAYDLATDPGETHPLDASGPGWAGMRAKIPPPDSTGAASIDPEVRRRLESLGYVH